MTKKAERTPAAKDRQQKAKARAALHELLTSIEGGRPEDSQLRTMEMLSSLGLARPNPVERMIRFRRGEDPRLGVSVRWKALRKYLEELGVTDSRVNQAMRAFRNHIEGTPDESNHSQTPEALKPGKPTAGQVREPPKHAIQAYQLYHGLGKNQTEVAEILGAELHRTIPQGTVSRWLAIARSWYKVNGLPVSERPRGLQMTPVDPSAITKGKRTVTTAAKRRSDD